MKIDARYSWHIRCSWHILKRNKAILYSLTSNPKGTSYSRVFRSSSSASSTTANTAARSSFHGITSLPKGHHVPSFRNMSTVASVGAVKEGLKVLVIASPRAKKMVGIWLFGSAAWVFSIVVPGGVARLTRSGLSMTDWKFSGSVPPLSDEEWQQEFEKYKQSPE